MLTFQTGTLIHHGLFRLNLISLRCKFLQIGRLSVRFARRPQRRGGRGFEPRRLRQIPHEILCVHSQSLSTGRFYVGQTKNLDENVAYCNANYSRPLKNRGPWATN